MKRFPNTDVYIIDEKRAIIATPYEGYNYLLMTTPEIIYADPDAPLTTCDISPVEASGATIFHNNVYLPLDGSGVIVGIIDTGIDYLNEEFINEDGTSRILVIADRTIEETISESVGPMGTIFTQQDINRAIEAKKNGGDPYAIVPSKDEIGHGTNMAGIVAARGANPDIVGVAPRCSLAIVKLRPATEAFRNYYGIYGNEVVYQKPGVLLGIRYLYNLSVQLKKPIVIYIPLGTNLVLTMETHLLKNI